MFQTLGIFENLLSFDPTLAETLVDTTNALEWLLKRIDVKEYDSNKQYASEVSRPSSSSKRRSHMVADVITTARRSSLSCFNNRARTDSSSAASRE